MKTIRQDRQRAGQQADGDLAEGHQQVERQGDEEDAADLVTLHEGFPVNGGRLLAASDQLPAATFQQLVSSYWLQVSGYQP
jgi:hypothetical protein